MTHHDYAPGTKVQVQVERNGRARWVSATFIGTSVGVQLSGARFLVVQARDGRVYRSCAPECVRFA